MAKRALPGLGLVGNFADGDDGWGADMDATLLRLSVLVQAGVKGQLAAVPTDPAPAQGDVYLLTAAPNKGSIAIFDGGAWVYFAPAAGWWIYDKTTKTYLTYDGAAWAAFAGGGGGGLADAPNDGKLYGRKNAAWAEIAAGSGGGSSTATKILTTGLILNAEFAGHANGWQDVSWSLEGTDDAGAWDAANPTRLTVPAGVTKVRLAAHISWQANSNEGRYATVHHFNAAGVEQHAAVAGSITAARNESMTDIASTWLPATAGDYFVLQVNSEGQSPYLSGPTDFGGPVRFSMETMAQINVSAGSGGGSAGYGNHRYWRLNAMHKADGNANSVLIGSLVFYGSDDVAIPYVNPLASSSLGGSYGPANVNDNNGSSIYASASGGDNDPWLSVDFGIGKQPYKIGIVIDGSAGWVPQAPASFTLQYSDDRVAWTDATPMVYGAYTQGVEQKQAVTGAGEGSGSSGSGLPAGGTAGQVLTKKSATAGDAEWRTPAAGGSGGAGYPSAPYWRIRAFSSRLNAFTAREIVMRATHGGPNLATGGQAIASSAPYGAAANAFDGDLGTIWATDAVDGAWIGYHFTTSVSIQEIGWTGPTPAANEHKQTPAFVIVDYSQDGNDWQSAFMGAMPEATSDNPMLVNAFPVGSGGGSAAVGAHRYWEFSLIDNYRQSEGATVWADCTLKDPDGNALVPTAVAGWPNSGSAASVFDGTVGTIWDIGDQGYKAWLRVDLGDAKKLGSITINHRTDYQYGYNQSPNRFLLRFSDDGIVWTTLSFFEANPQYASNADNRVFAVPQTMAGGSSGSSSGGGSKVVGKALGGTGTTWGNFTGNDGTPIPDIDFTFNVKEDGLYLIRYYLRYQNSHKVRANMMLDGARFRPAEAGSGKWDFFAWNPPEQSRYIIDASSVGPLTAGQHTVSLYYNAMDSTDLGSTSLGSYVTIEKIEADF